MPQLGLGVGLRPCHFHHLLQHPPQVGWFEIVSENFMDDHGFARHVLDTLRRQVPIVMHGVALSIGSTDPLDMEYLLKLRQLADATAPAWISDHLSWSTVNGHNLHDLMPLPLTRACLQHVSERVARVQDYLGRPLVLENPSTYLEYQHCELPEWAFFGELCARTGAGMLLDVNNVFVCAHNHGFDASDYLRRLPHEHIVQMHLAGPTDFGRFLVDTHDQPVPTAVWQLYKLAQELAGPVATSLEWDAAIPSYPDLLQELQKADRVLAGEIPEMPVQGPRSAAVSHPQVFGRVHDFLQHA